MVIYHTYVTVYERVAMFYECKSIFYIYFDHDFLGSAKKTPRYSFQDPLLRVKAGPGAVL